MGTNAKELGVLAILAGRFPMVRYNGHAFLSPEKLVTLVASDPTIRVTMASFAYFV